MKKVLLVLVSLAALAAIAGVLTGIFFPESLSASNRRIKGSGTIVTRTIPAPAFEKISASRAVKVIITEDQLRIGHPRHRHGPRQRQDPRTRSLERLGDHLRHGPRSRRHLARSLECRQHQRSRQGRRLLARSHKRLQDQGRRRGWRMPDQRLERRQDQTERPGRRRTGRTQLGLETRSRGVGRQTMEDRHLERRKRPDPLHRTTRRRGIERLLDPLRRRLLDRHHQIERRQRKPLTKPAPPTTTQSAKP